MTGTSNTVKIDLSAIVHNLNQVKRLIAPGTRIMGIVKSDAYGHGLVEVSKVLEKNQIDHLGVSFLDEALELRNNSVRTPITILCGIGSVEDAGAAIEKDLIPVVFDIESAGILAEEAKRKGKKAGVHIKIDTGMGRLGFSYEETGQALRKIMEMPGLRIESLLSHLSSADEEGREFTEAQIGRFKKALDISREIGLNLPLNSLANSAGIMSYKDSHFDMVRPGIMLYGGLPSPGFSAPVPLKQAMEFKARVLQIRDLPGKTPVSYGRRYYTTGNKKIAVVSAGYFDGIPRSLSNRGKVIIKGHKTDIVGTVCMNILECDTTGMNDIKPGDECILMGAVNKEIITGDDIAAEAGTISYEIFLSIGAKAKKKYVS